MPEMRTLVTSSAEPLLAEQSVEVVERKGIGHPDTICDLVAEEASIALCRYYLEHFGAILHHNVDKVLLVGGQSKPAFGGGRITEPIELILAGRATIRHEGLAVPVEALASDACREWLRRHLPNLDVDRDVRIRCRLRPGSGELVGLFAAATSRRVLSNDTSCGAGFAPMTPLEAFVLGLESKLCSPTAREAHPERGEDLKIMAVRRQAHVDLTVADAFVDTHVRSLDDYQEKRQALHELVSKHARDASIAADVRVNAADHPERGEIYLTVSGTSAEAGDDGEAGRGNRANGLITPYRPMTMESVAGKNPCSHVGKIYNVAGHALASRLVDQVQGVRGAECVLVSRIGEPIDEPQLAHVRVTLGVGATLQDVTPEVEAVVKAELAELPALAHAFVERRLRIV